MPQRPLAWLVGMMLLLAAAFTAVWMVQMVRR